MASGVATLTFSNMRTWTVNIGKCSCTDDRGGRCN
jgi:hypothetical protein